MGSRCVKFGVIALTLSYRSLEVQHGTSRPWNWAAVAKHAFEFYKNNNWFWINQQNVLFKIKTKSYKCPPLQNAFETDVNPIPQTTSGGGLGRIPDKTGQV